jgi:hypothetical protein
MTHQFKVGDRGKTRDGREYRVILTDARGDEPIVALVYDARGSDDAWNFRNDGRFTCEGRSPLDLMPPSPPTRKIKRWVMLYPTSWGDGAVFEAYANERQALERAVGSLMPDGKPLEVEIEILEEPRK